MEIAKKQLHIGITGGIGTGKSTVCKIFEVLGYPVFYADGAAKRVMVEDVELTKAIVDHFGKQAYLDDGSVNRSWLATQVFQDEIRLKQLNDLVHPATIRAYKQWLTQQYASITFKEAALLFETGTYQLSDYNILVVAPKDVKIARIMERDQLSVQEIEDRMAKQLPDESKRILADYIIVNDGFNPLIPQVLTIEKELMEKLEAAAG